MSREPTGLRTTAVACVFVASFLSGCASDGEAAPTTPLPSAEAPAPAPDTGSLTGVVTDEELRPVRAHIGLISLGSSSVVDEQGRYTFNDLTPGNHAMIVDALGYKSQGRRVEVRAGTVTHANFTLVAIEIAGEPFTQTSHIRALIQLSHAFVNYYVPREVEPCNDCHHYREILPKSKEAMIETIYTNGIPQPLDDLWFNINKNWTNATGSSATRGGQHVKSGYIKSGAQSRFSEAEMTNLKGVTKLMVYIAGGYTSVSVNKRVDFWLSFSYNAEFPENFTAMPPR